MKQSLLLIFFVIPFTFSSSAYGAHTCGNMHCTTKNTKSLDSCYVLKKKHGCTIVDHGSATSGGAYRAQKQVNSEIKYFQNSQRTGQGNTVRDGINKENYGGGGKYYGPTSNEKLKAEERSRRLKEYQERHLRGY